MKELIRHILREEISIQNGVKSMIKDVGVENAIRFVGGINKFKKIMDIERPRDFLNIFNDLDVVESKTNPELILFRYKEGKNIMVLDRRIGYIDVNYYEIYGSLKKYFHLEDDWIRQLIRNWLYKTHKIDDVSVGYEWELNQL